MNCFANRLNILAINDHISLVIRLITLSPRFTTLPTPTTAPPWVDL